MAGKRYSDAELQTMLDKMSEGCMLCGRTEHGKKSGWMFKSSPLYEGPWIEWVHYGESANRFTLKGIRFVVEQIFRDCVEIGIDTSGDVFNHEDNLYEPLFAAATGTERR